MEQNCPMPPNLTALNASIYPMTSLELSGDQRDGGVPVAQAWDPKLLYWQKTLEKCIYHSIYIYTYNMWFLIYDCRYYLLYIKCMYMYVYNILLVKYGVFHDVYLDTR